MEDRSVNFLPNTVVDAVLLRHRVVRVLRPDRTLERGPAKARMQRLLRAEIETQVGKLGAEGQRHLTRVRLGRLDERQQPGYPVLVPQHPARYVGHPPVRVPLDPGTSRTRAFARAVRHAAPDPSGRAVQP